MENSNNFRRCSNGDDCGNPDVKCVENVCICIHSLQKADKSGQCKNDIMEYKECTSDVDCDISKHRCQLSHHIPKKVCMCVDILKEAKADGSCTDDSTEIVGTHDVFNLTNVVAINNRNGNLGPFSADDNPAIYPDTDTNRTTNKTPSSSPSLKGDPIIPNDLTLMQIFIPLSFTIVAILIIIIILYKRWRLCKRKHVRNKDSVVKSNEGIQLLDRMNVVNKNSAYFMSSRAATNSKKTFVNEIPMERVKILDIVGEGAFGQVFRGDYIAIDDSESTPVAVKVLKEGVSNEVREDFQREVEIMSAFDHDNILKLLGVITRVVEETPYMIFEYMSHGDLAEMLRRNDPVMRKNGNDVILQKTDLIDIATQIANGMTYLTSQHFVHRDLATRNCLVGESLIVKISDFGMARDVYTCDYYRIGGSRMLPVRWMSPESVKYGRFTTESDIWAYGVVLWEIFSFGRQPYYGHSNEEVVRFLDEGILLQRPDECPSTVYHLMLACWKTNPKDRLLFSRIYSHLVDYSQQVVRIAHNMHTSDIDSETEMLT